MGSLSRSRIMSGEFPVIKSTHSLVAKHVTKERWDKVKDVETKTCGFTLAKAIACAVDFDNQHCGIYAGDWDSYKDFAEIFDAIIQEYHGISATAKHTSDMDPEKVKGNIEPGVPVHSTRIRVGRNVDGFGLSPVITKQQRIDLEKLFANALKNLTGDLAGKYYPLTGELLAPGLQLVHALLGPAGQVHVHGGAHAGAEVGGTAVDEAVLLGASVILARLGLHGVTHGLDAAGEAGEHSLDVSALLHGDDAGL